MNQKLFVGYYRRSKKEKTYTSSLGMDTQPIDVAKYVTRHDGNLIAEYTEYESGMADKRGKRTAILDAINKCKETGAVLLIARMDRLARDAEFVFGLLNSKVRFEALDIEGANDTTVQFMAVLAEQSGKTIRKNIVRALQEKKKRGEPLGWHTHKTQTCKLTPSIQQAGTLAAQNRAAENPHNKKAREFAYVLFKDGFRADEIASKMNNQGFKSPSGISIGETTVYRWVDAYCRMNGIVKPKGRIAA